MYIQFVTSLSKKSFEKNTNLGAVTTHHQGYIRAYADCPFSTRLHTLIVYICQVTSLDSQHNPMQMPTPATTILQEAALEISSCKLIISIFNLILDSH